MMHALDIMRVNSFIAYNNLQKEEGRALSQKDFVLSLADMLQK